MNDNDLFYRLYRDEKQRREKIREEFESMCVGAPDWVMDPWSISAAVKPEFDAIKAGMEEA